MSLPWPAALKTAEWSDDFKVRGCRIESTANLSYKTMVPVHQTKKKMNKSTKTVRSYYSSLKDKADFFSLLKLGRKHFTCGFLQC